MLQRILRIQSQRSKYKSYDETFHSAPNPTSKATVRKLQQKLSQMLQRKLPLEERCFFRFLQRRLRSLQFLQRRLQFILITGFEFICLSTLHTTVSFIVLCSRCPQSGEGSKRGRSLLSAVVRRGRARRRSSLS